MIIQQNKELEERLTLIENSREPIQDAQQGRTGFASRGRSKRMKRTAMRRRMQVNDESEDESDCNENRIGDRENLQNKKSTLSATAKKGKKALQVCKSPPNDIPAASLF